MIAVFDFGGQTAHLISRRIRELGVYSQIVPATTKANKLKKLTDLEGIALSGGPASTYQSGAPMVDKKIFSLGLPVLGICYGLQLMGRLLGGRVKSGRTKEYGGVKAKLKPCPLFKHLNSSQIVWMSHGDQVTKLPQGFVNLGRSINTSHLAMGNLEEKIYGVQFHPEVVHTKAGKTILKNFVFGICKAKKTWSPAGKLKEELENIKDKVGPEKAIAALSGGVDSLTAASLVYKVVGKKLKCVYVNTGLMREGEEKQVVADFKKVFGRSLKVVKAEKRFLTALRGVRDPEKKRKAIGKLFIDIFASQAKKWGAKWLVQGTIYPDVIESAKKHDAAATIKSHHNVGGLPKKMPLKLIEPLRDLYKDEVRSLARKLKLPTRLVNRQPFPGPGLAVRIRGEVTEERLNRLRQADAILQSQVKKFKLPKGIWMTFAVYVPLKTTGVKGDGRSFEDLIAIRSVTSLDAMTADWTRLPYPLLASVSARIVNEVAGINRVVYDITSKPPATMEWE